MDCSMKPAGPQALETTAMTSRRIHLSRDQSASAESIWEPRTAPAELTSSSVLRVQRAFAPPPLPAAAEAELLHLLTRTIAPGETYAAGNARREGALMAFFASLSLLETLELLRRIDAARGDDPIFTGFTRFTAERRARLRGFLRDTRRRHAHQQAG